MERDESDGEEPLVNAKKLARLIGHSVQSVRRMARDGTIPAYRFAGQGWRFRPSEVLARARSGPVGDTPAPTPEK